MKIASWEKIVLVWVNALKLADEELSHVSELFQSTFFLNLIACLGKSVNAEQPLEDGRILKEVSKVLKEEFKGFAVAEEPWDDHETTLVTSLLLLLGAFKSHDLRTPLYSLCGKTQLVIQSFIQKFISIHEFTPLDQISRDLLITSLTDLCSDEDDSPSDGDHDDFESSPPKRLLSSFKTISSPELQGRGQARMKSLECQLELLSWDKQHLVDEVDMLKADLSDLRSQYERKAAQVLKLENELFLAKNSSCQQFGDVSKTAEPSTEVKQLRNDLDTLSHRLSVCSADLDREQSRNAEIAAKLEKTVVENVFLTEKCAESDLKIQSLQADVQDLEEVISSLKATVKDQADLLSDSSFIAMSPNPRDVSLNESAIAGETMANVVEIKYREMEDELGKIKESLLLSERKVSELEMQLESKNVELAEKEADLEELREDNEFLSESRVEKRQEMALLVADYFYLKNKEANTAEELRKFKGERECCCGSQRLQSTGKMSSVSEELVHEIAHLGQLLEGKQVRLEESTVLLEKIKRELSDRDNEKEVLTSDNESLKANLSVAQAKMQELINDLAEIVDCSSPNRSPSSLVNKIAGRISSLSSRIDELTSLNEKYEKELIELKEKAAKTTEKASGEASDLHEKWRALESEFEDLTVQHRVRGTEMLALQQTVSMCEHEKAILQRRIDLLTIEADRCESMKNEIGRLKSFVNNLEMELSTEKIEHKRLRDQVETTEKLNVAFDSKLSLLQSELKSQYDKDISRAVDEYNEKITLMKRRMQRDKSHIKELSNELWETSDRYLLASQEADALRNQLRRMRKDLELVSRFKIPQKENIIPQSSPCLWSENQDAFDERVTVTRERWLRRHSGGGSSIWSELSRVQPEGEDEVFDDGYLEDLKAGVVRLPQQPVTLASRASCPHSLKDHGNGSGGDRVFANDKQSLIPPEKPKRKGQSLDRVGHLRDAPRDRESQPSRLSRLFSTMSTKSKTLQAPTDGPQPSAKRKGFFRKFGTNRENIPPWH